MYDAVLDGHALDKSACAAFAFEPGGDWAKGFPFQFASHPLRVVRPAPALGEHTAEILREVLGLTESEIAALETTGATAILPP